MDRKLIVSTSYRSGWMTMSEKLKLQRRADELAQLAHQTLDHRIRNILILLSQEFRLESDHLASLEDISVPPGETVPRFDET